MTISLPSYCPTRLPLVIKIFTYEIQLGFLLCRRRKVELQVMAIEFLFGKGDGRSGVRGSSSIPACHGLVSGHPGFGTPRPPQFPLLAHHPRQSQVTHDGQNDNCTGCDEIAKGAF